MNKVAPVGIILLALLAIVLVFLLNRETDPHPSPEDPTRAAFAVVRGKVLDPAGAPLPGVPVRAFPADPESGGRAAESLTDEEGAFLLHLVPSRGMFEVRAYPPERPPFPEDCIVHATPDREIEVILREPAPPSPEKESAPNVAGAVGDQHCRAQAGVGIEAVDRGGRVLAHTLTDRHGRFEMQVDAVPPISLRFEGGREVQTVVTVLPSLYNRLIRMTSPPRMETLYVRVESDTPPEDPRLMVQIFGPLKETLHQEYVQLTDFPHRIN